MNRFAKGFFAAALAAAVFLGGLWAVPQASAEGLSPPRPKFTDLPSMPWYYDFLTQSVDLGFFSGTSSTTFSPDRPLTRAQAVVVLSKVHKELTGETISASQPVDYTDVSPNSYYSKAVAWATVNKIVSGRGNHRFAPNQPVTHAELAVMFHRYLELVGRTDLYQPIPGKYENEAGLPGWAKSHAQAISGFEIFDTYWSGEFTPRKTVTRDEASALFVRLYEKAAYPIDNETPRQSWEYFFLTMVDGSKNPFLPLGEEHAKIITSYEEYEQLLAAVCVDDKYREIQQPAPLTVTEDLFTDNALLAVEVQHEGEPAYRCDLGNLTVEGDTASVTLVESNRGGTTASTKGVIFFVAVPKNVDSVKLSCLTWTEAEDWMPS